MTKKIAGHTKYLVVADFHFIVNILRKLKTAYSEDIPPFNTRNPGILEAVTGQIKQNVFGKELYPGIVHKAAMLFYLLTKNHPFTNGNKRVAVLALILFLKRNVAELYINHQELTHGLFIMAIKTTESNSADMAKTIAYLKRKIRKYIITP